ncbi:MAG: hypothetical protein Q7J05_02930 [Paludibacter sp.]|nr:hypothetical protein [Paludibacter sp.]
MLCLMLSGCASKRFARIASKYEQAEMYSLAVDNYMFSLQKKNEKNDDARIGLMRSSKRYSDELEMKINEAYAFLQDDQVVGYYMDLQNLKNKLTNLKVDVDISLKALGQFEEAKNRHLRITYTKAQQLLDMERFKEAEEQFAAVLDIDKHYERAAELHTFAVCEPIYRASRQHLVLKLYRSAYYGFGKLLRIDAGYKDAVALQKEALQYAMLTVAIQPFKNGATSPLLANQIEEFTRHEFVKQAHPLLRIVSTDYSRKMLEEQRLALANNLPFDASLVIPVRVFLSGNIISSQYSTSRVQKTERKAYLRYRDKDREEKFKKVNYVEYAQSANATIQFGYEYIRVENAIVIASDVLQKSYSDQVTYARSEYDVSDLLPGDWGEGRRDTIYTDKARLNAMRQLFDARSVLADKVSFESSFAMTAAAAMYKKLSLYDPEK